MIGRISTQHPPGPSIGLHIPGPPAPPSSFPSPGRGGASQDAHAVFATVGVVEGCVQKTVPDARRAHVGGETRFGRGGGCGGGGGRVGSAGGRVGERGGRRVVGALPVVAGAAGKD